MSCSIAVETERESEFYTIKSIYIPRIFENITQDKIKHTFEILDLGIISHIDLVARGPSKLKMAFVHFKEWFNNPSAQNLAKKILDPNTQAKLVYDDPWYWILLPNNKPIELPREETIEGLKQIICEYKLIIDDLEAQLFETWKQDDTKYEEKHLNLDASSISPVCSTSSWEMSDFDDKTTEQKSISVVSTNNLTSNHDTISKQQPSCQSGFVAKISNWHSVKEREFKGHVNFEHLKNKENKEHYHDIEMGLKNQHDNSTATASNSKMYSKIVPFECVQQNDTNDISILIEDNVPCDTMFDSKGNRYVKQNGKWFKIEQRKVEQHFWCDP